MSHYSCPVCTGSTSVIETRVSKKGLRRRRRCGQDHRFTTIELPHDTGKRITGLVNWLTKQGLDQDLADYAQDELKAIMSGQPPEDDEDVDSTPPIATTPVCGPTGTHGLDPRSAETSSQISHITRTTSRVETPTPASAYQDASEATPRPSSG